MGDRHGGRFARRGRALSPTRPQVDAHRGVRFRWRATVFRCRGVVGRIYPRRNTPLGEGLPKRRTSKRICPAREGSPRRKHPDTAHERKDLSRAGTRPLGESLPTRRTSERICPAQEHAPRRKPPDTAHERKDLPHARTLSSAKASRHSARAKGFAPRRNTPLGEGLPTRHEGEGICPRENALLNKSLPTRRTGERICPTREHAPRRRPPDTAHERKNLPRAETRSSAKASRHGARAKEFAPRGSPSPHVPTNGGPPSAHRQPKNTPSAGSHPQRAAAAEFIHLKK